jgi:hypothetical protein
MTVVNIVNVGRKYDFRLLCFARRCRQQLIVDNHRSLDLFFANWLGLPRWKKVMQEFITVCTKQPP